MTEAKEEAKTQTSMTDKIMEATAPVTAAAAAAGAAVVGFVSRNSNEESGKLEKATSPIPGTFPETPVNEETESTTTAPIVDEAKKTDNEPTPEAVFPSVETSTEKEGDTSEKHDLETVALGTDETAAATGGFAAALEADKKTNTAPIYIEPDSQTLDGPPESNNDLFGILPVPSETAPEGTKPLAKSTFRHPAPADLSSLAPEPITPKKEVDLVPESKFEPVTSESNVISTAGETSTSSAEQLKSVTVSSSEDATETAAKALATEAAAPPTLDATETLSSLHPEAVVTATGTTTEKDSDDTGLSPLVTRKDEEEEVNVQADAKATHVEPAIILDDAELSKPTVETSGESGNAAVVTDGGKEILENGKPNLPEAHLQQEAPATPEKPKAAEKGPATPAKDTPVSTPSKTPVSKSSAKKNKRASGVPSESGSEKKKGGFLKKLRKIFS